MIESKNPGPRCFLLVGHGPNENRGCEAIVRGTATILRQTFGPDLDLPLGIYAESSTVERQQAAEPDGAVRTFGLHRAVPRWSAEWFAEQGRRRLGLPLAGMHVPLRSRLGGVLCALEIGGDNYSLDYGFPHLFLGMDRFLQASGLPVVIWGASVGPFDGEPALAPAMFDHLRTLDGIFVRESSSRDYLGANGIVQNVHLVADPAFVMDPTRPREAKRVPPIPSGTIGLNFSPLVARNVLQLSQMPWELTADDIGPWVRLSADMVKAVCREFRQPVLLIPHVGSESPHNDDASFLQSVHALAVAEGAMGVTRIEADLTAPEIKWVISQCNLFAGTRTHATIAALSSGVPTLSLGYSLKARGLNQDIFGHLDYCLGVSRLTEAAFIERCRLLLGRQSEVREHLRLRLPQIRECAFRAGGLLRNLLVQRRRMD